VPLCFVVFSRNSVRQVRGDLDDRERNSESDEGAADDGIDSEDDADDGTCLCLTFFERPVDSTALDMLLLC
jgi:hypothetical protein